MNYTKDSNLYDVLGVAENCTFVEIGKAYKCLARTWHPDKRPQEERTEATRVFQNISNAKETLSDPAKRLAYDRSLEAARRKREREAANEKNTHQNRKQKLDPLKEARIFTVYYGKEFKSNMCGDASINAWVKSGFVECYGTICDSLTGLRGRGLFTMLTESFGVCITNNIDLTVTSVILFVSFGKKSAFFTSQNLNNTGKYDIDTVESALLDHLDKNGISAKEINIAVFSERAAPQVSKTNAPPSTVTRIQIVFDGIKHKGTFYVDNRCNNPPQSRSQYAPIRELQHVVAVADVWAIAVSDASLLCRSINVTDFMLMRVTGHADNLSSGKSVQNYKRCEVLPSDDTTLAANPVLNTFAVFPRGMPDDGIANAGGSRTYYNDARNSSKSADDVINGFIYQLLVQLRQGKTPSCMRFIRVIDKCPQVLARTLGNFVREIAGSLETAELTSARLEDAMLRWPAVNLPPNFAANPRGAASPTSKSSSPESTTSGGNGTSSGATFTSPRTTPSSVPPPIGPSAAETVLIDLCSTASDSKDDNMVRVSLSADGAGASYVCAASVLFLALLDDPRAQHLRGRVYLQLAEPVRELAEGTWLLVERASHSDDHAVICQHPVTRETVKIRKCRFFLPQKHQDSPGEEYGAFKATPEEDYA